MRVAAIPTFYGEWFMNRLLAGYCKVVNPYGRQIYRVSLLRQHVQGIVFWTKNLGPFLARLPEVRERGFPFVIQYSINGYPRTRRRSRLTRHPPVADFRAWPEPTTKPQDGGPSGADWCVPSKPVLKSADIRSLSTWFRLVLR
jgi:hypothetical protein